MSLYETSCTLVRSELYNCSLIICYFLTHFIVYFIFIFYFEVTFEPPG